jgi:plastocyanin
VTTTTRTAAAQAAARPPTRRPPKTAEAEVTITLDNPSSIPHAVEIEGHGVEEESGTIGEGETTKVTATVKPGEYEYYCPVDGHKAAGMTGTLTVQ